MTAPAEAPRAAGDAALRAAGGPLARLAGLSGLARLLPPGVLLLALLLTAPLLALSDHVSTNYNEGWNAYLALRALAHDPARPLYPPPGSMVFNNYPPLSFPLVGLLGRLTGDMIVAGRIVALAALLAGGALVACCVRRMGGRRDAALAAGLMLPLFVCTGFSAYVGIDDPQWLAHALMLGGLAVLLGGARPAAPSVRRAVLAALLVAAGGFVKHNLIALPLAATAWLAWHDRRALAAWCGAGLVAVLGGFALARWLYGPAFLTDLLHHDRVLSARQVLDGVAKLPAMAGPLLAAGLLWLRPAPGGGGTPAGRGRVLVLLFLALALVTGLAQRLGDGVNYNAQFETLIAACLATGLVLARDPADGRFWRLGFGRLGFGRWRLSPARLALVAAMPALAIAPFRLAHDLDAVRARPAEARQWQAAIGRLRAAPGPAACETLALCYWAGKDETVDFFNLTQAMLVGRQTFPLDAMARRHVFGLVELNMAGGRHREALAQRGRDPVDAPLRAAGYVPLFAGPDRTVFLAPPPVR
ncbi:hypothetical protein [Nguyenibacter sp. L1]|uniref:hypothetical protein n=1 Tax=Nguyenibacter sp. L1 TaxID=3049350 RepID=UPI002B47CDE1|nr:hypothetical protein [Nguyenibacter sp. L1]WRH86452.1 hypothetical protein QN315_10390 [Nguyenibacter sp. L1]